MENRRFWVVSPNVNAHNPSVKDWRNASVYYGAAFMGWQSDDLDHKAIGHNFAHKIKPNDVILIARRFNNEPQIVGFGVVKGKFLKRLPHFTPPGHLGSIRKLSPFIPISRAPKSPELMHALRHTMALRELHPQRDPEDLAICEWMLKKLGENEDSTSKLSTRAKTSPKFAPMKREGELEYEVRTREATFQARKLEEQLVQAYAQWLENQDRTLTLVTVDRQRFDAYEEARHNLIEAKCNSGRQYIRMAVGQLLEYSFLLSPDGPKPNLAILLPSKPDMAKLSWLAEHNISVVYRKRDVFLDNANGQFM